MPMSADALHLEADQLGAFPAFLLLVVLVLTMLGVLAHVAFA
jgi:hypothetical protein